MSVMSTATRTRTVPRWMRLTVLVAAALGAPAGCVTAAGSTDGGRRHPGVPAPARAADPEAERELASHASSGIPELDPREVDRRVIVGIRLYANDSRDPSGRGRVPNWSKGTRKAVDWLEREIDAYASAGVRRIVLINPAGSIERFPPDPLRHMDPERVGALAAMIGRAKQRHPGLEIGIYVGSGIDPDPSTLRHARDEIIQPDFDDPQDRERVYQSYAPIPRLGVDFLFIDNITGGGGGYEPGAWLAYLQDRLGIKTYGEAIPTDTGPGHPRGAGGKRIGTDRRRADAWRYMGLARFIDSRNITTDGTREHYVGLNGHHEPWRRGDDARRRRTIAEYIGRGFVPFLYAESDPSFKALASYAVRVLRVHDGRRSGRGGSDR